MTLVISSHRKTRKGTIVKIVREHYLRDDIHCGLRSCSACKRFKLDPRDKFAPPFYLSENPRSGISSLFPAPHYLVVDASLLTSQIDLICDDNFGEDILILQTVWKEVKPNIPVFSKLQEAMASKRIYLFDNEHNRESFRLRQSTESIAQYKQNLTLEGTEWLRRHFGSSIQMVYLTNFKDLNTVEKKEKYSFDIVPIDEYVKSLSNSVSLMDKLANLNFAEDLEAKEQPFLYAEHLPLHEVQAQIKNGCLYKGKLRSSPWNYLEATVTITRGSEEMNVVIQGRENINRAVNEDVVAIKLLPKSEWKLKAESILDEDAIDKDDEKKTEEEEKEEGQKDAMETDTTETLSERPMGQVVSIIKRNWRSYCGVIREKKNASLTSSNFFFVPVDKRIPFIRIETRQYEKLVGKKILVSIDCWNRDSKYPRGHYMRIIGESGSKETETDVLLLEHAVPHVEFSALVLNCLPAEGDQWRPREEDLRGRVDFRDIAVCSVDPPGCTDIDDALHCRKLGDDGSIYEVGVHIADVSHFIKPGTAIDKEAAERGTTVYLADRRIDMVPGLLSSNLCSLREEEERLSFSCVWNINSKTGEIVSTQFTKSIIKSKAALTYAEAQLKIDSATDQDEIAQSLRRLNQLAKVLKAKRIEKGALVLASANEIKFVEVDSETADSELVILEKKHMETNSMVEEFMLLANISVAQKIYETFPEFAVLRRHPKPSTSNFEELIKAAANRGFDMDVHDGKSLSASLNRATDPANEHLNLMLRMITTRCMSQAVYFCSGALSADPSLTFAHYGLASEIYTHFTSPIRRYADIMVHRLLAHAIHHEALDPLHLAKRKIFDTCEHINMRNMNARRASRASNELHSYLYVRNSKDGLVQERGNVFTLKDNALVIFIMHLSFEVVFFLDPKEDWSVEKEAGRATHLPSGTVIRQFDRVLVELSIDRTAVTSSFKKQIRVRLVEPAIPIKSS